MRGECNSDKVETRRTSSSRSRAGVDMVSTRFFTSSSAEVIISWYT